VTKEDGGFASMGGKLPKPELTVQDIADMVGRNRMVDVIGEMWRWRTSGEAGTYLYL
jgi:hypothetical protein